METGEILALTAQVRLSLLLLDAAFFSAIHLKELGVGRQGGLVQWELLRLVQVVEKVLLFEQ